MEGDVLDVCTPQILLSFLVGFPRTLGFFIGSDVLEFGRIFHLCVYWLVWLGSLT